MTATSPHRSMEQLLKPRVSPSAHAHTFSMQNTLLLTHDYVRHPHSPTHNPSHPPPHTHATATIRHRYYCIPVSTVHQLSTNTTALHKPEHISRKIFKIDREGTLHHSLLLSQRTCYTHNTTFWQLQHHRMRLAHKERTLSFSQTARAREMKKNMAASEKSVLAQIKTRFNH